MKWKQMTSHQKRKLSFGFLLYILTAALFLGHVVRTMLIEKNLADVEYASTLDSFSTENADRTALSADTVPVTSGAYVETIKNISLKDNAFRVEFILWFRWENGQNLSFLENNLHIRNGTINHMEVLEDYHDGALHYQSMRIDATISKNFDAACFPLGTQVLSFYISPENYTSDTVILVPDTENSGINSNLSASGYSPIRSNISSTLLRHLNTMGNPLLNEPEEISHLIVALELNRNSWGLFFQCFIALFGTVGWILITLYICANHRIDPLLTLPPALFGAVSNLIVGTNLLPDMAQFGLVEYMNFYGILMILAGTLSIIQVNRIRDYTQDHDYADSYGRVMFFTLLILSIAGMLMMPAVTYRWR